MSRHVIDIPQWRPALDNELIGCHPKTAGRRKKLTLEFISVYAFLARVPKARGPRRVDLTIAYPAGKKMCDPTAPWKSLLDALVRAELLIGDAAGDYQHSTTLERGPMLRTRIALTDID